MERIAMRPSYSNPVFYSAIGLGSIIVCTWLIYKWQNTNKEQKEEKPQFYIRPPMSFKAKVPEKYILFLDIDGTLTKFPGDHNMSLFNLYFYTTMNPWYKNEEIVHKLFENENKLNRVKNFVRQISETDPEHIELIITSNNIKEAIQQLWNHVLKCPWNRVSSRSAFRDSGQNNKINLINHLVDTDRELRDNLANGRWKALYFEDEPFHLSNSFKNKPDHLNIIQCSNGNWLGNQLPDEIPDTSSLIGFFHQVSQQPNYLTI